MRTLYFVVMVSLFGIHTSGLAQCGVTAEAYPKDPQPPSGAYYYGVRVTLQDTCSWDVTVTGTIHDLDNISSREFSLTIPAGYLFNETNWVYFQACYECEAEITVNSVLPCPGDTNSLYLNPNFKEFANSFLISFLSYTRLHNNSSVLGDQQAFIQAISNSDGEDESVAEIYNDYTINFDSAMIYKNQMDNSFLKLLHDFSILVDLDSNEVWEIVMNGISLGMNSNDGDWISIQNNFLQKALDITGHEFEIASSVGHKGFSPLFFVAMFQGFSKPIRLTPDEVWDCAVQALGIGAGSVIGIGALKKLAKEEGIQAIVVTVSKWLAKKAGWIGAIVTLLDFSSCIYQKAQD